MECSNLAARPSFERYTPAAEVMTGCSWDGSAYCALFGDEQFSIAPLERFERDLDEVKQQTPNARRVWFAGGSPFGMSFEQLQERAMAVWDRLIKCQSIAMFASIPDIAGKSDEELRRLRALHVNGLAVTMGSACDETLELTGEGYRGADVLMQCRRLDEVGIEYSLLYTAGLAGRGRGRYNARMTAEVLNQLNPKVLEVQRADVGESEPARQVECLDELRVLIEELQLRVHLEASSLTDAVPLMGILPYDKPLLLAALEQELAANS